MAAESIGYSHISLLADSIHAMQVHQFILNTIWWAHIGSIYCAMEKTFSGSLTRRAGTFKSHKTQKVVNADCSRPFSCSIFACSFQSLIKQKQIGQQCAVGQQPLDDMLHSATTSNYNTKREVCHPKFNSSIKFPP